MPLPAHSKANVPGAPAAGDPPLFSFVLICWNHARFVGETLASISAQDYPHWECIAIDNGSTDGSRDIIDGHAARDTRMRTRHLPRNIGQLGAALSSLDEIRGEFVCFVDSDDILFPYYASVHVGERLANNRNAGLSNSDIVEVADDGSLLSPPFRPVFPAQESGRILIERHERRAPLSPGTSNVFRRDGLMRARILAPERMVPGQAADNLFFRACHLLSGSLLIHEPLSAYRIQGGNQWAELPTMSAFDRSRAEVLPLYMEQRLQQAAQFIRRRHEFLGAEVEERFWLVLERLLGSSEALARRRMAAAPVRDALREHRDSLMGEFGAAEFSRRVPAAIHSFRWTP